jgi:hypothetical protein
VTSGRSHGRLYLPGQYGTANRPTAHQVKIVSTGPDNQSVHTEQIQVGSPERYAVSYDVWNYRESYTFAQIILTGPADPARPDTPAGKGGGPRARERLREPGFTPGGWLRIRLVAGVPRGAVARWVPVRYRHAARKTPGPGQGVLPLPWPPRDRPAVLVRFGRNVRDLRGRTGAMPAGASGDQSGCTRSTRASTRACSYHASPVTCQGRLLWTDLWVIWVNTLVSRSAAVDGHGCGKVDNPAGTGSPARSQSPVPAAAGTDRPQAGAGSR